MSEVLFILTVIFGAYVFCVVTTSSKKSTNKSTIAVVEPEKSAVTVAMKSSPHEPVSKTEPLKTVATESVTDDTNKKTNTKKGLKNPKSGEIATSYTNYRFTKRWIKEALVSEGLLEKVYKNNELNADTEAAIKAAIARLETMEQYRVS